MLFSHLHSVDKQSLTGKSVSLLITHSAMKLSSHSISAFKSDG